MWSCSRPLMSRSAWMAKGEPWTTCLRNASGAPSSMRRSIFTIISHHERHVRPSHAISRFIIKSAFTRHLITKLLLKCIFTRHKQGEWRTQSRRKEKEESSSYLNRFLCLDNVGHHTGCFAVVCQPSKIFSIVGHNESFFL